MDAVVVSSPVNATVAPSCLVLMDEFQFLQPDDVVKTLGEVKATRCPLDPFLSWFIKAARKRTVDGQEEW